MKTYSYRNIKSRYDINDLWDADGYPCIEHTNDYDRSQDKPRDGTSGYSVRLPEKRFLELKPVYVRFITRWVKKTSKYRACYGLKQPMTDRLGYLYQADLYEIFKELGFEVKIDSHGYHFVKAGFRKRLNRLVAD